MKANLAASLALFLTAALTSSAHAQEKPLESTLVQGAIHRYRVQLTVRSELEGQQVERAGDKAVVTPLERKAAFTLEWVSTRRVVSVSDGVADVQETFSDFSAVSPETPRRRDEEAELSKMRDALGHALESWSQKGPRELRYRETAAGQLQGVNPLGAPLLDEAAPQLLTPWLLRALRPAVTFPARPVRFGESWQEPRAVDLPNWGEVRGAESGEWLEAQGSVEPAARLHVVQQIFGKVARGAEMPPEGTAEGRFHGESLAAIALSDGRLLAATRSAAREITWLLAPVEGLAEPPRFRGRLSVEIRIEEIP